MKWFERWRSRRREGPMVRPWAIAGPVLVLLLAAPLLRPLWAPGAASDAQQTSLEAMRSVLRHGTLELNPLRVKGVSSLYFSDGHVFATDPPVFTLGLAGVGWAIERCGVNLDANPILFEYLLIFFGITLPTALACGLLYRMGRVFELRRWWRMILALACVLGTGWFSYAVVLLPHAPAAALVVASGTSVMHLVLARKPMLAVGWLTAGGFCAALAGVIEPTAAWALPLMPLMILALAHPWRVRLIGLVLVLAGAAAPIVLHVSINHAITGDIFPPRFHDDAIIGPIAPPIAPAVGEDIEPLDPSLWLSAGRAMNRLILFTFGSHGIFSHFPVLLVGLCGALIVLHRHWTAALKWLAGGVLLAILLQLAIRMMTPLDISQLFFAAPRLVVCLPLLMLLAGAWIRRSHARLTWALAGVALGASVLVSLIGATGPAPQDGFTGYTAAEAATRLFAPKDQIAKSHLVGKRP